MEVSRFLALLASLAERNAQMCDVIAEAIRDIRDQAAAGPDNIPYDSGDTMRDNVFDENLLAVGTERMLSEVEEFLTTGSVDQTLMNIIKAPYVPGALQELAHRYDEDGDVR